MTPEEELYNRYQDMCAVDVRLNSIADRLERGNYGNCEYTASRLAEAKLAVNLHYQKTEVARKEWLASKWPN